MPTVAAFDSGNLEPVAKALKEAYPDKPIIIAGDDDISQSCKMKVKDKASVNVGREKALETAKAVGGVAVFPVFAKGEVPGKTNSARLNRRRILLTRPPRANWRLIRAVISHSRMPK